MLEILKTLGLDREVVERAANFHAARGRFYSTQAQEIGEEDVARKLHEQQKYHMAAASCFYKATQFSLLLNPDEGRETLDHAGKAFLNAGSTFGYFLVVLAAPPGQEAMELMIGISDSSNIDRIEIQNFLNQKYYEVLSFCFLKDSPNGEVERFLKNTKIHASKAFGPYDLPYEIYRSALALIAHIEIEPNETEPFRDIAFIYQKSIQQAQYDRYHWENCLSAHPILDIELIGLASFLYVQDQNEFFSTTEKLSADPIALIPFEIAERLASSD